VQNSEDWQLWKWLIGIVGSMLGGAAVGGWVGRGMVEEIKQQVISQNGRIETLETDQRKCQSSIKDEIRAIVQQALDRQSLANADLLGTIRTELAVISALHGETQQDVKELFRRLERRKADVVFRPSGERRDQV
jgi:hypothetical protein